MKAKIYLTALILLFITFSCFEDDGNYEYETNGLLETIEGLNSSYATYVDGKIEIDPTLSFSQDEDLDGFEYKWQFITWKTEGGRLIYDTIVAGNEKKLELDMDASFCNYGKKNKILFSVKNKNTGAETKSSAWVIVKSKLMYGTYLLCEKGAENSELTLITEEDQVIPNVYDELMGGDFAGKPLFMTAFKYNVYHRLNVYTTDQATLGKVFNFKNMVAIQDARICFYKDIEDEVEFKGMIYSQSSRVAYSFVNDRLFTTSTMAYGATCPYFVFDAPVVGDKIISALNTEGADTPFFQSEDGFLYSANFLGFSKIKDVTVPGKMIHAGRYAESSRKIGVISVESSGAVKEYEFESTFFASKLKDVVDSPLSGKIDENTIFTSSSSMNLYVFNSGNKIYTYNYKTKGNPVLLYEFPAGSDITHLEMIKKRVGGKKIDSHLEVATHLGTGDESASFYHINTNGEVLKSFENICGKIVDVESKYSI